MADFVPPHGSVPFGQPRPETTSFPPGEGPSGRPRALRVRAEAVPHSVAAPAVSPPAGAGGNMMGALHLSLIEPKMVLGRQVASDPRGGAVVSALLEDTHLPMALVDLEGRYQFVSDAKARLLNATPERLVGRTVGEVLGADLG